VWKLPDEDAVDRIDCSRAICRDRIPCDRAVVATVTTTDLLIVPDHGIATKRDLSALARYMAGATGGVRAITCQTFPMIASMWMLLSASENPGWQDCSRFRRSVIWNRFAGDRAIGCIAMTAISPRDESYRRVRATFPLNS